MGKVFLLSLFSLIAVAYTEELLDNNSTFVVEERIVGGTLASISKHKYHVAVIIKPDRFQCGGSLIRWRWVITAAHCTYGLTASNFKIRAGTTYWNKGGVVAQVVAIHENPKFTYQSLTHDTSLMKLKTSIKSYSSRFPLKLIGIATKLPPKGTTVHLAGWGSITTQGLYPDRLRKADFKIIARDLCKQTWGSYLDGSMFCAGKWDGGKGACYGDSGGGLRYNGLLIGTVSYGNICAAAHQPTVYANLKIMRDWILKVVKNK